MSVSSPVINRLEILKKVDWLSVLMITLAFFLLLILVGIPLLMILLRSFAPDGTWEWLAPLETMRDRDLGEVFLNSFILGILVVIGSTLLASPMAFLMAKTNMGRNSWIDVVLLIPFMTPPYINSMGWILFVQPRGYFEQFFPFLGSLGNELFFSLFGMVLVMSLNLFPFIYLVLRNTLTQISGSLEDAGAILGGSFLYRLRRIILPLSISGYTLGALLIFVNTIAEFGTPATLGRRIGFYVLTTEIHRLTSNWPIDFGRAAALSSILLGTSLVVWYVQSFISNRYAHATVGTRGRSANQIVLGKWQWLAWGYLIALVLLSVGVPYFSIASTSLMQLWGSGLQWNNLTLAHYAEILTIGSSGFQSLMNSLQLSLSAATLAMTIGTLMAVLIVRSQGWVKNIIDALSLVSNTIPSIVMIVGLILFWNARWLPATAYNTWWMLVITYVVLFLPYTVQYVKGNLEQLDSSLFEAAYLSGANRFYIFYRIIFPLAIPGMIAGWMMTFIISIRELVGSLIIRPPGLQTTATFIFGQFEQGSASVGMAMAMCSVFLTTVILISVNQFRKI